ncbi:MAG: hypothetical protein V7L22_11680, partial [Nostoc sp.]
VFHASANKRSLVFSKFSSCTSLLYCQCVSSKDITLCCFEKTGDFCHRYQVGEEILQELWGGEVGADQLQLTLVQGKTNHPISSPSELAGEEEKVLNPKPINLSPLPSPHPTFLGWQITTAYPPLVSLLIEKCHALGYPVVCVPASPVGDALPL